MTFDKIFPHFKAGKAIRRLCWDAEYKIKNDDMDSINIKDLMSEDWIIVGLQFCSAVNALLDGKKIAHAADVGNPSNYYCYRDNQLYKGLGTNEVKHVEFNLLKDQYANDWVII